jgi:WD40 repeat protein
MNLSWGQGMYRWKFNPKRASKKKFDLLLDMKLACFNSFQPQPVTVESLAYDEKLAIFAQGSADGSITLFDSSSFATIGRIPSCKSRSVRRLVFYEGYLISCGVHGSASMWDLKTLTEVSSVDSSQGAIWDMALDGGNLYLATETGCVVVVEVSSGQLRISNFLRSSSKAGGVRALSICAESGHIFVGDANGTISRWTKGSCDATFSIPAKNDIPTLIWSLAACGKGQIVSGDSLGSVSLWDANSCTLIQARQDHQADVLTLSCRNREVFSSGVDSRVIRYLVEDTKLKVVSTTGVLTRDITALAVSDFAIVAGGADARLATVGLKSGMQTKLERFSIECIVRNHRVFCQSGPTTIRVYDQSDEQSSYLAELENGNDIFCFDTDGSRVAIGSASTIRLLNVSDDSVDEEQVIQLSENETVTALAVNERYTVAAIADSGLVVQEKTKKSLNRLGPKNLIITHLILMGNRILAVAGKDIHVIALSGKSASKQKSMSGIVTAVSTHNGNIVVATSDHTVRMLDSESLDEKSCWSFTKKLHRYVHVRSIEVDEDSGVICLFGESLILSADLEGPNAGVFKFNPSVPTGGVVVGSGKFEPATQQAKKPRTDSEVRGVVAILANYKQTSKQLITPFEKKQFQQ